MSEVAIRLQIKPLAEGGYVATSPDVPGLVAEGRSLVEVAEIARDVARKITESCIEHGDPLPSASNHTIAVNNLLGYTNCVAMISRKGHSTTPESNEQIYLFFERFLKSKGESGEGVERRSVVSF